MNKENNIFLAFFMSLCLHLALFAFPVNTIINTISFQEELFFNIDDLNSSVGMSQKRENTVKITATKPVETPPVQQELKVDKPIDKEEKVVTEKKEMVAEKKEMLAPSNEKKIIETESNTVKYAPVENIPVKTGIQSSNSNINHKVELSGTIRQGKADLKEVTFGAPIAPKFLHRETPSYPFIARKLGKEGKVLLRLTIDEHGNLRNIEVLEKADYGFTEAAIEAVKKSTFLPAIENSKPIPCKVLLPIKFMLRS